MEPIRQDGRPAFTYNFVGLQEYTVNASERLAPGDATIQLDFAYDGDGRGKGGTSTISVNGQEVGFRTRRANQRQCSLPMMPPTWVIDEGTNVSSAYKEHDNRFTGRIEKVRIEVK